MLNIQKKVQFATAHNQIMILRLTNNTVIFYYTIFTIFAQCVRPKCWLKNESLGILQSSSIKVHQTLFECNIESSIMRFLVQTSNFVSKLITCTLFIWMLAGENPKITVVSKIFNPDTISILPGLTVW